MNKKIFHIITFLCFTAIGYAQNNNIFIRKEDNPELKVTISAYFGISLLTQADGTFLRYGYIQIKSTGETKITYITRSQFVQMATGQLVSKANPEKTNILEQKEIMWQTFETLWKLRYAEFPYDGPQSQEKGWAGRDFAPSDAQWAFLKQNYGFNNFDQFLYGDNMWKLVKDSQDPAWQSQYSSLR